MLSLLDPLHTVRRFRLRRLPARGMAAMIGALLAVTVALPAMAQSAPAPAIVAPRAVVELFTSQGCSSCPAADHLFVDLARDRDLLVLTLPVDYWDYLGWKDTLASPTFSRRQRHYAKTRGDGQIYTPQAIVNGQAHLVGSDRRALSEAVRGMGLSVAVEIVPTPAGHRVQIGAGPDSRGGTAVAAGGSVWLAPIVRLRTVQVQRGENKGREVHYANVVRGLIRLGDWQGGPQAFDIPRSLLEGADMETFAVLLHGTGRRLGPIIGAAKAPGFHGGTGRP